MDGLPLYGSRVGVTVERSKYHRREVGARREEVHSGLLVRDE